MPRSWLFDHHGEDDPILCNLPCLEEEVSEDPGKYLAELSVLIAYHRYLGDLTSEEVLVEYKKQPAAQTDPEVET
eukprot:SAG22_NODE_9465_length_588_cov_1.141104_1_plen_74_part_10